MTRHALTALLTVATLFGTQINAACYVCNKQAWDDLHPFTKEGLVSGAISVATQVIPVPNLIEDNYKRDLSACLAGRRYDPKDLVAIVDNQYLTLTNWTLTPDAVLLSGVRAVCLPQLNEARALRGEAPLLP